MKEKFLLWTPRILAILAILFMMMFSMDCFGASYTLKEKLICFAMHNIPAAILILVLIVAWKREIVGGFLFIAFALAGTIFFRVFAGNLWALVVLLPLVITGILFILHRVMYKKQKI